MSDVIGYSALGFAILDGLITVYCFFAAWRVLGLLCAKEDVEMPVPQKAWASFKIAVRWPIYLYLGLYRGIVIEPDFDHDSDDPERFDLPRGL